MAWRSVLEAATASVSLWQARSEAATLRPVRVMLERQAGSSVMGDVDCNRGKLK
jgi:hypothetical protein